MPIKKELLTKIKDFDWIMLLVVILLVFLGITVISSATYRDTGSIFSKNVTAQLIFIGAGFILMFIFTLIDYRIFRNFSLLVYFLAITLLVFVLVYGKVTHGATRWIELGFFKFQPSELTKLVLIITLAEYFSRHAERIYQLRHLLISGIYVAIPTFLVLLQPDLGTALVFIAIWFALVFAVGIKKIYILATLGVGALSFPIFWHFLKDYQKLRILTFLNPKLNPLGAGYNVIQSIVAVGSGEFFGRGLGHGPQSQLKFLPAQHTDFIFASLAEELGFFGAALLLVLFIILIITRLSRDNFGALVSLGILIILLFQILINIGMNLGIMPITGIPLPLISYGGSSLITTFIAIGLLQSIVIRHRRIAF